MELKKGVIYELISSYLPGFEAESDLQKINGGNLNHVWRLEGKERSFIIKHAPPYIASNPDVPLSSERIHFEAKALSLFDTSGILNELASDSIRPPALEYYSKEHSLLIMEDVGELPELQSEINDTDSVVRMGETLGDFIGELHKRTFRSSELKDSFNNHDIQKTRNEVQYQPAADYAGEVNESKNDALKSRMQKLGKELMQPGRCLVMGDLWPPSILVKRDKLRIIDWEFAHFGRPLQDTGHFAAHCWMQAHTSFSATQAQLWQKVWESFWQEYRRATGNIFPELFDHNEFSGMKIHIAAEILIRAVGPFKAGYVYNNFPSQHPKIKEAVKCAILTPDSKMTNIWNSLFANNH